MERENLRKQLHEVVYEFLDSPPHTPELYMYIFGSN